MKTLLLIFSLFGSLCVYSQVLRGTIYNQLGTPLDGATIFIKENIQGIVVDSSGYYNFKLEEGIYNLQFAANEYTSENRKISLIKGDTLLVNIKLQEISLDKTLQINGKEIKKNIVDNLIRSSNSKTSITSFSYVRGQVQIKEVSNFIDKLRFKVEKEKLSDLKNQVILHDLYAKIVNIDTDSCKVHLIKQQGEFSLEWHKVGILTLLSSSLYQVTFKDKISPLNIKNIQYYNFTYLGSYFDEYKTYHKIKIESPIKDSELLDGYLYFDDSWQLCSAVILIANSRVEQTINIRYYNMNGTHSLPITVQTKNKFEFLGTRIDLEYLASINYNKLDFGNNTTQNKNSSPNSTKSHFIYQFTKVVLIKVKFKELSTLSMRHLQHQLPSESGNPHNKSSPEFHFPKLHIYMCEALST